MSSNALGIPGIPSYLLKYQQALARTSAHPASRGGSAVVARVSQLDAGVLDTELEDVLYGQLSHSLLYFKTFRDTYEAELKAGVQCLLYGLGFFAPERRSTASTYGAEMQNLRLAETVSLISPNPVPNQRPGTSRLILLTAAYSLGPYAMHRLERYVSTQGWSEAPLGSWKKRAWDMIQKTERWYKTIALLHFALFLHNGQFRSIIERVLGLRWIWASRQSARGVSFEFLNRQLVWHAFTEFLMFIVPLVDLDRFKMGIRRLISRQPAKMYAELPEHICAICVEEADEGVATGSCRITLPYITDCGHTYCYRCVEDQRRVEWDCLRCDHTVKECTRVGLSEGKTE